MTQFGYFADISLTEAFKQFINSEKSGSLLLIASTIAALLIANSSYGPSYLDYLHLPIFGMSLEHWVNDGLMAIFFLLIGLELERELYNGELSDIRKAMLPIIAAIGGVAAPALIHLYFNLGLPTQSGIGIPMATDIAFALGALAILGKHVPTSLKVFVVAFAIADDLIAIIVIALFYSNAISIPFLLAAIMVLGILLAMNRLRVMLLLPYLVGGVVLWFFMLKSGIHVTLAGVLLAFAIPFSGKEEHDSPSERLEHYLLFPVSFVILPIFALVNTGIVISADWATELTSNNSLGIILGLVAGKPIGILVASILAIKFGFTKLPGDLNLKHLLGAGLLGGIGFTMSIFICNLAFYARADLINASKMAILLASLIAGCLGFLWLKFATYRND